MSSRNKVMATRAKASRKQRPKKAASTSEQILQTAERLFIEKGYRATSVHEIAAESGFTTGALYWNFGNKEGLFLEILERRLARTLETFRSVGLETLAESPDSAAALGAAMKLETQEPAWVSVFLEFLSSALRNRKLRERVTAICEPFDVKYRDAFTKLFEKSPYPADRLAGALYALLHGLWICAFVYEDKTDFTVVSDVVDIFLAAKPE